MSTAVESMTVNEDHAPSEAQEAVLRAFKHDMETFGESRMTPQLIRRRLDELGSDQSKQNVNYALSTLTAAGWVRKIADGLYEFVEDPRNDAE